MCKEWDFIIWLSLQAGKEQILCSDWLPECARWAYLACLGLPDLFPQKRNFLMLSFGHIINSLLSKLAQSRWLDISLVLFFFFCIFMDLDLVLVHKSAKRTDLKSHIHIHIHVAWNVAKTDIYEN